MATSRIFDNFNDANWAELAQGSAVSLGTPFTVSSVVYATKIGFYRAATGTNRTPQVLMLWDTTTQTQLIAPLVPTDNGSVGWKWTPLVTPVALIVGREYRVVARWASGQTTARYTLGTMPTPPSPWSFSTGYRCYVVSGSNVYPSSADNQYAEAVQLEADDAVGGGVTPPVVATDLTNALTAWFADTGDNTHRYNATVPNIADVVRYRLGDAQTQVGSDLSTYLAGVGADVGSILASVGSGLGGRVYDIQTSVGTGLNALADAAKTAAEEVNGLVKAYRDGTGSFLGYGWKAFLDSHQPTFTATGELLANIASWTGIRWVDVVARWYTWLGGRAGEVAVPGTGWANVASTNFTDDIAWAQPADLYVVTFSDTGANDTTTLVSNVDIVYRLAWWMPINGTQPAGQRRFIDTPIVELSDGGARMPGILLHCPRGGAGIIDAWQFTG